MTTKRLWPGILALGAVAVAVLSGWLYHNYLRGVRPAVLDSSRDIAVLAEEGDSPLSYPAGFDLSIFARGLPGVRVLRFDQKGTLLASLTAAGKVVALPDADGDGRADRIVEVLTGLDLPHGLAFSPGPENRLFVAETDKVMVYTYDPRTFLTESPLKIASLPGGGRHSTRTLLFDPASNGRRLLVSVGSSCDTCREEDWRRAKILVLDLESGELDTYASGLRNAVFMAVRPATKQIWATEMGRDYLGDNLPPDEIDRIERGRDYGWPFCYGDNVADTKFLQSEEVTGACEGKNPSFIDIQAHSAPLGLDFFPDRGWPEKYRGNLLVAYHGSWNRTVPTGYKVMLFRLDDSGSPLGREDFISGWLQENGISLGRPVDVRITENGTIFLSDDKAGVVYRMVLKE